MNYYLDTEFNEFRGELISLALVSATGKELYLEQDILAPYGPWVAKHVVPLLTGPVVSRQTAQGMLAAYFVGDVSPVIICDWPADISHLCDLLDQNHGNRLGPRDIAFYLVGGIETFPEQPHNALSDARALRAAWRMRNGA